MKKIIDEAGKKKAMATCCKILTYRLFRVKKKYKGRVVCVDVVLCNYYMDDVDAESPFEEKPFKPYNALYTSYFVN